MDHPLSAPHPTYPVLLGGVAEPGDGWVHWPRASALLGELYEVMALKARLDHGRAGEGDAADPRLVGRVARSTDAQARTALALARKAQPGWARVPLERRLDFVRAFHQVLRERAEEFTGVLVTEGHPLTVARWGLGAALAITHPDTLDHARQAMVWEGKQAGRLVRLVRKPDGVVCLNPARNASLLTALFGVLSLAAGNTLIVNAPPAAPLGVAYGFHELVAPLLAEYGAPYGTLSVLCAPSRPMLRTWLESPECDDIFYFGSSAHGAELARDCLEHGKKPVMELAGNDALVVWRDADLAGAVEAAVERYHGSGQLCIAPKFALVHPAVADEFTALLHRRVAGLRVGPPEDPDVVLSPVVKRAQCADVLDDAVRQGAELLCGGELVDVRGRPTRRGPFIRPVLLRVRGLERAARMRAVAEETFFPLMCVVVPQEAPGGEEPGGAADDDELFDALVAFVNGNRYGLRNSLWARDSEIVDRFADEVSNGGILKVNDSHIGSLPVLPVIGGTGLSGGVFGEANLPHLRTTRLQGISVATADAWGGETAGPGETRGKFDHLAAVGLGRTTSGRPTTAVRDNQQDQQQYERKPPMATLSGTALLHQKFDVCFGHLDADGNGSVDREDLLTLGAQLLAKFGESATSPKGTLLMDGLARFWDALSTAADADGDKRLTPEEYRNGMTGAFITSAAGFDQAFRPLTEAICGLLDTDGDGEVDEKEFLAWQEVFRTSETNREAAFRHLDADGSGKLSVNELLAAQRQYYTSPDADAAGNWLFGTLA
ncbi:aldehyde dehydrogenase family protein [Streptomyces sp. NPDC003042]